MAYFEPYIDAEGIHIPTYQDRLDNFIEKYKEIFGEDVYLGVETPDYQLLSVFAKALDDYAALAVDAYNARSPKYATGNSLDILVELAGIRRRAATKSKAVLTVTGEEGTIINTSNKAIDDQGRVWSFTESSTIPASGTVDIDAECDTEGAISAPIGTINGIYTPVPGWETVTNETEADIGLDVESDADLRARFAAIHAISPGGMGESITSGLMKVEGVEFAKLVENSTGEEDQETGLPAHSICAIVSGGDDQEIADSLYSLKSPGVGTFGDVTKQVIDSGGRLNDVSFQRPSQVPIEVEVVIVPLTGYDADSVIPVIKSSLLSDVNALGIGQAWSVTLGYKDIYSSFENMTFSVASITATDGTTTSTSMIPCEFDEMLHLAESDITITT